MVKKQIKTHHSQPSKIATKDLKPYAGCDYLILATILILSVVVFIPVLSNGFVNWDDDQYVLEDKLIRAINLKDLFSTYYMGNYHPLTLLFLAFEFKFFGLSPIGYHVVNILLHVMNIFLVYKAVLLLSERKEVAYITALLFGIHPIHVESVAWVSEIKDLLYTFFFLVSYIYYLKYFKTGKKIYYAFSLLIFLPALLSKAMAASLPLLLMVTDYFKGRKINLKFFTDKIPYFILAILFGVIAVYAQKSSGSIGGETLFALPQRIIFASYGYFEYFIKLIFPFNLSAFYSYPVKAGDELSVLFFIFPLLLIAFLIFIIYTKRFTNKIIFGVGFFTVTVILVLQFIPVGSAVMADRYAYIPSIGLFYLVAELIYFLFGKGQKIFPVIALGIMIIFFSATTYARCKIWKDSKTLWTDVINKNQTVALAYNSRGVIFDDENKFNEAYSDYSKAIELNPNYDKAYNNRGNLLMKNNKFMDALLDYNKSAELNPGYFGVYKNRGHLYESINKPDSALNDYNKALSLEPGDAEIYFYRGNLYQNLNRYEEALNDYANAIAREPANYKAYNSRAILYMNTNKLDESYKDFSKAISIYPSYADAYINRGNLLQNEKKNAEAMNDYTTAISLQPNNPKIYYNRGNLNMYEKKYSDAINDFSTAIKIKDDYVMAYFGRGIAQCNSGNKNAGCPDLQFAYTHGFQPALNAFKDLCNR